MKRENHRTNTSKSTRTTYNVGLFINWTNVLLKRILHLVVFTPHNQFSVQSVIEHNRQVKPNTFHSFGNQYHPSHKGSSNTRHHVKQYKALKKEKNKKYLKMQESTMRMRVATWWLMDTPKSDRLVSQKIKANMEYVQNPATNIYNPFNFNLKHASYNFTKCPK